MPENEYVTRYGKATAKPGKGAELGALLVEAASQNATAEGCLQYEVNVAAEDPDTIWVTEKWTSREAIDASLENEDAKAVIAKARPLIENMEMVELKPLGGIGAGPSEARPGYTIKNLEEVKDSAVEFGLGDFQEARFATRDFDLTQAGFSFIRIKPGQRQPFGHTHDEAEEVYVVIRGTGKVMIGSELLELKPYDAIRIGPGLTRAFEAGPDGLETIALGQDLEGDKGEAFNGWWGD